MINLIIFYISKFLNGENVGLVLFLEEDHFAAEDFLSVLSLMKHERDLHHPNCDILCLGTYLKQTNYKDDHKKVSEKKNFFLFLTIATSKLICVFSEFLHKFPKMQEIFSTTTFLLIASKYEKYALSKCSHNFVFYL